MNKTTVLYWYRLAAEAGSLEAQLYLANYFEKEDIESSIYWYEMAAIKGDISAKEKISFKSPQCIRKNIVLLLEDGTELVCPFKGYLHHFNDYIIITDPDTNEYIALLYKCYSAN